MFFEDPPKNCRLIPAVLARLSISHLTVLAVFICWVLPASLLLAEEEHEQEQEQGIADVDPWAPFRLLVGSWEGSIDGRLGSGTGIRQYDFILDGRFLRLRHSSVRLPQELSPEGDNHEEIGIFSFDRERNAIIYRQFINEGFVNQYICDVQTTGFVCTTENMENGAGWSARESITITNRFQFEETFELALPGKELTVYFTNSWTRRPDLDSP